MVGYTEDAGTGYTSNIVYYTGYTMYDEYYTSSTIATCKWIEGNCWGNTATTTTIPATVQYTLNGDVITITYPPSYKECCWENTTQGIWCSNYIKVVEPSQRLREIIQARQAPHVIIRPNRHLLATNDVREVRARETLKRVLGENKFRLYLAKGFVSAAGKSGRTYQIFPAHGFTNVYKNGMMIERLCVVLNGQYAPTDSLIMRYLLILSNEDKFRALANVHIAQNIGRSDTRIVDQRTLPEIYANLRRVG